MMVSHGQLNLYKYLQACLANDWKQLNLKTMYVGSYSFTASSKVHRWENKSTLTCISIFRERFVDTHYHTCLTSVASVSKFVSHLEGDKYQPKGSYTDSHWCPDACSANNWNQLKPRTTLVGGSSPPIPAYMDGRRSQYWYVTWSIPHWEHEWQDNDKKPAIAAWWNNYIGCLLKQQTHDSIAIRNNTKAMFYSGIWQLSQRATAQHWHLWLQTITISHATMMIGGTPVSWQNAVQHQTEAQ